MSTRRLRTLLWLGTGAALGLIVVRRLALRVDDAVVECISNETARAAVGAVTSDVLEDLRNFTTLMLIAAIVIGLGAYLAGRPPWLSRSIERVGGDGTLITRETAAVRWLGEHAVPLRICLVVIGAAVLLVANLGWASLLIVVVLVAAGWCTLTYLRNRVLGNGES